MEHHFNVELAKAIGVDEAIFIHNIYFWIKKNEANKKHFYDKNYWTYNSMKAFTELFPYWSQRQIERIIKNCVDSGYLLKANYNSSAYDRTSWYAITELVEPFYANGGLHSTKHVNGFTQTVPPIPYNKPNSKQDNKTYYRVIKHLKLSFEEFEKLKKLGYGVNQIDGILDSIENYKKNVNYSSLFLTSKKWLEKEYPKKEESIKKFHKVL